MNWVLRLIEIINGVKASANRPLNFPAGATQTRLVCWAQGSILDPACNKILQIAMSTLVMAIREEKEICLTTKARKIGEQRVSML